jgi:TonB family protein
MEQPAVIVAGGGSAVIDSRLVAKVRGNMMTSMDIRFMLIVIVSLILHGAGLLILRSVKVEQKQMALEDMSQRFVKLIVDKPMPKLEKQKTEKAAAGTGTTAPVTEQKTQQGLQQAGGDAPVITEKQRAVARKAVERQVARVEQKIRTVGVLGMLTGVGGTAKGPMVVDVLGAVRGGKEHMQDLDKALDGISGLQKAENVATMEQKLVKSKDVTAGPNRASIDMIIAGIGAAQSKDLAKQGDFVISKPEAIEGAGAVSSKRDTRAINDVVLSHKSSVKMSYEKFLKRDPNLAGKITIRFTITAAGTVSNVEVLENSTGNTDLEGEIIRKIQMWKFDPVPEGDATVTYPFVFKPS